MGQRTFQRKSKSESITMRNKNEKRVIREWRDQPTRGRDINLPAIFRRWTSKSSALATGSSQGSVLDRLVNVWVLHRRRRVSQKGSFRGRCQTCLSKSNKMRKARLIKRVAPKFAWMDSEVWVKEWWCSVFWEDEPYTWLGKQITRWKEIIGGTPHGYTFYSSFLF